MLVAPKYTDYTYEPTIAVPKRKKQNNKHVSSKLKYAIISLIVLAFGIGLALTSRAALYYSQGYEITRLNREIESLQTDNERLKLEIEQLCSLDRVENMALTELGMVKPSKEDIKFLPVNEKFALTFNSNNLTDNDNFLDSSQETGAREKEPLLTVWSDKLSMLFVKIVEASEL